MASTTVTLGRSGASYGASELRALYQRYWAVAFGIAVGLHLFVLCLYHLFGTSGEILRDPLFPKDIILYPLHPLHPLPSIEQPGSVQASSSLRVKSGVPIPVPEHLIPLEEIKKSGGEIGRLTPLVAGRGSAVGGGHTGSYLPDAPGPFLSEEHPPKIVRSVEPAYPLVAIRAGIEGTVVIRILVDAEGRVSQAVVEKSDNEILNKSALQAARSFVFTPGSMNSGPASVWVSVPFRFTLSGGAR